MPSKINYEADSKVFTDKPKLFAVILHNDDYTTKDFVVMILMKIFKKSGEEANLIMETVHKSGQCAVSAYPYDIALTKKMQTEKAAEEKGFPLRASVVEME